MDLIGRRRPRPFPFWDKNRWLYDPWNAADLHLQLYFRYVVCPVGRVRDSTLDCATTVTFRFSYNLLLEATFVRLLGNAMCVKATFRFSEVHFFAIELSALLF